MSEIWFAGACAWMVFWTDSGNALNLVPTAPVGVNAFFTSCTTPLGLFGISLLRTLPSAATINSLSLLAPWFRISTFQASMPFSVVFDTPVISPLGDCERTVFCTAGGNVLNACELLSTLWLQPTANPAAAIKVTAYTLIGVFIPKRYAVVPIGTIWVICYRGVGQKLPSLQKPNSKLQIASSKGGLDICRRSR